MRGRAPWLVALLALTLLAPAAAAPRSQAKPALLTNKPGRVWVRFKQPQGQALHERASALAGVEVDALVGELNAVIVKVAAGQEAHLAARLAARPDVAYALAIPRAQAQRIPNDEGYSRQWGLAAIRAAEAWDVITGTREIVIAVVDTGVDLSHPDLAAQVWTNPGEVPGNGLDDDGNGKVDDVHGWHFYQICSSTECYAMEDANVQDDHHHGTHVAGVAAAATDNRMGVAGVAWGARIMPVKVLGSDGEGWYDDIVRGILYAADNGARIINLSLGGPDPFPPLQEALAYARARGALSVAATGNKSEPVYYPAAYPEAMAVAATDSSDARGSFSNYGPAVSVAAPGVGVESTLPGGQYGLLTGTSVAAPHVAGLAALIWSLHPDYSASQVQRTIELSASDVNAAALPGRDHQLGWGRIDAGRAVRQRIYGYQAPLVHGSR